MKRLILLIGACAGAATFVWLRGGGDLAQLKDKAKRAVSNAENELDNVYPSDQEHVAAA